MKKILFIVTVVLSGGLFAQSECYDPYPIILSHPVQPLVVPLPNPENYTVLGYTLKLEGYPPIRVMGNEVMTEYIMEYIEKNCHVWNFGDESKCYVLIKELAVRRNSDGNRFTLGGDKYLYAIWYPIVK